MNALQRWGRRFSTDRRQTFRDTPDRRTATTTGRRDIDVMWIPCEGTAQWTPKIRIKNAA